MLFRMDVLVAPCGDLDSAHAIAIGALTDEGQQLSVAGIRGSVQDIQETPIGMAILALILVTALAVGAAAIWLWQRT